MSDNRSKYTLDQLLRAKRSEKPDAEFWNRFEREFKAKQKQLIQRQLASETRLKAPLSNRIFRVGSFAATFGVAAVAVYLGFQTPVGETSLALPEQVQPQAKPTFSVAASEQPAAKQPELQLGLQEFSTLATPPSPRVVVQEMVVANKAPTPAQIKAITTLASLEKTIKANRASQASQGAAFEFVSSNGLFDSDLAELETEAGGIDGYWSFEDAYLLGKYADPLTGSLPVSQANRSLNDVQHVSFSQLDDILSSQSRQSDRSLDALTVRF